MSSKATDDDDDDDDDDDGDSDNDIDNDVDCTLHTHYFTSLFYSSNTLFPPVLPGQSPNFQHDVT